MALIECEICKSMISDKANQCPKCNTCNQLIECAECKAQIRGTKLVCPECGLPEPYKYLESKTDDKISFEQGLKDSLPNNDNDNDRKIKINSQICGKDTKKKYSNLDIIEKEGIEKEGIEKEKIQKQHSNLDEKKKDIQKSYSNFDNPQYKLFPTASVFRASLFGSLFAGFIIISMNYKRLNLNQYCMLTLIGGSIFSLLFYITLTCIQINDGIIRLLPIIHLVTIYLLKYIAEKFQGKLIDVHISKAGKMESGLNIKEAIIAISCLALLLIVSFIVFLIQLG